MKKVLVNYGGVIFLYFVIFFGVLLVSTRLQRLNNNLEDYTTVALNN